MGIENWNNWFTKGRETLGDSSAIKGRASGLAQEHAFVREAQKASIQAALDEKKVLLAGVEKSLEETTEQIRTGQTRVKEQNIPGGAEIAKRVEEEMKTGKRTLLADHVRLTQEIKGLEKELAEL